MIQDLKPETYIVVFVFAGLVWAGLMALGVALWIGFNRLITPTPKPKAWSKDWESMEREDN